MPAPEPLLSNKEMLQQILLWYPVQSLSHAGSYVFNGVPAFILTLVGSVEQKRIFDVEGQTLVIRFAHPQRDIKWKKANNYSYALLVEAYGTLADYSGWLLFFAVLRQVLLYWLVD